MVLYGKLIIIEMSSFMDRFTGRVQSIPKIGIDNILIGKENSLSRTRSPKCYRLIANRINTDIEQYSPPEEPSLHLPCIQHRIPYGQCRNELEGWRLQSHSRVYLDKETKWLIEEPLRQSKHNQKMTDINNKAHQTGESASNQQEIKKQSRKPMKQHHIDRSMKHLGGLGANIGGEQWLLRKQKQDRAMKYAMGLKRPWLRKEG